MPPIRSLREGPTLEAVRDAVRAEFGAGARIVSAERVTSPGIGGMFRRSHVEAVVEVPDPLDPPTARVAIADGPVVRVGIAALLADAEAAEARIAAGDGTATTRADAFASVLDGFAADGITTGAPRPDRAVADAGRVDGGGSRLQDGTELPGGAVPVAAPVTDVPVVTALPPVLPVPPVPTALPAGGPDGAPGAGRAPAAGRARRGRRPRPAGGTADGRRRGGRRLRRTYGLRPTDAADRRSGILARADGVRNGHALLGVAAWDDAATTEGLAADQVWVVVDVGRKPEDTRSMVAAVAARTTVAGVVAIGAGETATPESVHLMGVPVLSLG